MPKICIKNLSKPTGRTSTSKMLSRRYRPSTKVLRKIRRFQKTTGLLIPKMSFLQVVREILQREHAWHHIQASMVLALHEVAESYLTCLFKDTNLCVIHAKGVTILPKICSWQGESGGNFKINNYCLNFGHDSGRFL